jgi:ATP-binding cassette subfamily F protein 3
MLTVPDLMIMDEPDVFLDFDNLNSLKDLINSHKGIMLIITHNRYLLNHCFNKIIHLEIRSSRSSTAVMLNITSHYFRRR